jgi:O-antigen/teichoic acid export membrane protein
LLQNKLSFESRLLLKNSIWVYIANFSRVISLFVKALVITQFLGPRLYGEYLSILAFTATIQAFFNLNFGTTFIKFGTQYLVEKQVFKLISLFKLGLLIAFVSWLISIVFVYLFLQFSTYIFKTEIGLEINTIYISFCFGIVYIDYLTESFLRILNKFKFLAINSIINSTFDLCATLLFLIIFKPDLSVFLFGIASIKISIGILFNVINFIKIKKEILLPFIEPIKTLAYQFNEIRNFIASNYGGRLIKNLIEQSDVLILGYFSTQTEVGIYGVGKRIGYAVLSFIDPLVNAIFPQLNRLISKHEYSKLIQMIRQFSKISIIPIILLTTVSFFLKEEIVVLLFGDQYIKAAPIFFFTLLAALIASFTFWNISLLISLNEVNYRFIMNIAILITTLFLSYVLVPIYGAIGTSLILLVIKLLESFFGSYKSLTLINKRITSYE